eukprot:253361_1
MGSKAWLTRHTSDHFVRLSKQKGYRSRAAFKLLGILDRYPSLLRKGNRVIDLGASPGSWSSIAVERVGKEGSVVAVDLLPMEAINGVEFVKGDMMAPEVRRAVQEKGLADCILSDMCPNLSGNSDVDHQQSIRLCEEVLLFSIHALKPEKGSVLLKVLRGGREASLMDGFRDVFNNVRWLKPDASRKESREIYLLASM